MLLPFFYHTVSDDVPAHVKHLYPVKSVKQFEDDLEFLLKNYEPFDPTNMAGWKNLKKPKFLLTFDDGMKEVGEVIAPILLKKGVPAIFFVCKDFAQRKAVFHKHLLSLILDLSKDNPSINKFFFQSKTQSNQSEIELIQQYAKSLNIDTNPLTYSNLYLSENEIQKLAEQGFLIGGHSLNHPDFSKINTEKGHLQITECMDWINQKFAPPVSTFAFPFADFFLKKAFFEELKKHTSAPLYTFGTSEGKTDIISNSIQRIDAEKGGAPIEFIIKNYRRKKLVRKLLGRNKLRR